MGCTNAGIFANFPTSSNASHERRAIITAMAHDYYLELNWARVAPAERTFADGIVTQEGTTAPFLVERSWSGPAGHYNEQWFIRDSEGKAIFEGPTRVISVRGFQSESRFVDVVGNAITLVAGSYQLTFLVEGRHMGAADIEVKAADPAQV